MSLCRHMCNSKFKMQNANNAYEQQRREIRGGVRLVVTRKDCLHFEFCILNFSGVIKWL
jgi:hypothetical protein